MVDDVKRSLNALVESRNNWETKLRAAFALSPIPAARGVGTIPPPGAGGGGTGIASPLTEGPIANRTYWPAAIVTSSDGIFTFSILPTKSLTFTDANASVLVVNLSQPA